MATAKKSKSKKKEDLADYGAEMKVLRAKGPERVYILRGEGYLRDSFVQTLRQMCVEDGTETFNYHQFKGASLDVSAVQDAVDAMPFMAERTFIEIRDFDVSRTSGYDPKRLRKILEDVPEWATVAFVFDEDYALDARLIAVKAMKQAGKDLEFASPREAELARWVIRRVEALGKQISYDTANYLTWVCGTKMYALIQEITKIAGAVDGPEIQRRDIDLVAKRAPQTTVYELADALGAGDYDKAAKLLADLLDDKDEPVQKQLYWVNDQFQRLFVARVAQETGRGTDYILSCFPDMRGKQFRLRQIQKTASRFSCARLARAVCLCEECDFASKNNGPAPEDLMKELILRLALDKA